MRQRRRQIASRVFQRIKAKQVLPRSTNEGYSKNLQVAVEAADELRLLARELSQADDDRLKLLAIMIVKIEESLRSSVLLLSLGLLEDHFSALRRHVESIVVFVFVAGRGEFADYVKGNLKVSGKKVGFSSKPLFDACPFAFANYFYKHFRILSGSLHPKTINFAHLSLAQNKADEIANRKILDSYTNDVYPHTYARFCFVALQATKEITNVYREAAANPSHEVNTRLEIMNYLFHNPEELNKVYNMRNLLNSLGDAWEQLKSIFTLRTKNPVVQKRLTLHEVISDAEMRQLISNNKQALDGLSILFSSLWMGSYLCSRF
ncbi:hypothetical protein JW859_04970 [bacterium]|nr:hypothetical protein [bacterium]